MAQRFLLFLAVIAIKKNREELGALQHRVKEDFVGVNILACEVSEHGDVLRTLGQRQFNLQRVIVSVGKRPILRHVFD